jgi:glucosylceramidase
MVTGIGNMGRNKIIRSLTSALLAVIFILFIISCKTEETNITGNETNITEKEAGTTGEETSTEKQTAEVAWKVSTQSKQWQDMGALSLFKGKGEKIDTAIDLSSLKQEIDGFGGAFNEKGWKALSLLTPDKREAVIKELFDPQEGAKFNICRVPIGASDYAASRYTLDETKNDFKMKNFSIERDKEYLIPYVKAAMEYRPDLQIWGSVWTPPTWMKTNEAFDGGNMKDDTGVYGAFALYLARFVEEYQAEGINVFASAVQNEPLIEKNYPSCLWTPEQFLVFVRDYMGPTFEERNVQAKIMLGTIQDGDYSAFPDTVLSDPEANSFVSIVGFQWDGLNSVAQTRSNYPDKKIMQTETECGNWYWRPDFKYDPDRPQNDWAYGVYTWNKIKAFFDEGVNSYLLWNMVLDEEGKSIDAVSPWPQDAAIVVDKNTKEVIYTPMFYAFKHFTFFVEPGAHYVDVGSSRKDAIAFLNPDGELVIVLQNDGQNPKTLNISIGDYWLTVTLPEMSWSTLVVPSLG